VLIHRTFGCSAGTLWRAVTEPEAISTWFETCRPVAGHRYSLRFEDELGRPYVKFATPLHCERRADGGSYRFLLEDEGFCDSTIEVRVTGADSRCEFVLRHDGPDAELAEGYRIGWADYVDRLERQVTREDAPDRAAQESAEESARWRGEA
jgi:hypothetical protein